MENFKFNLLYVFFVVLILALGFLGYTSLDSGSEGVAKDRARKAEIALAEKERELEEREKELERLREIATENETEETEIPPALTPSVTPTTPTPSTTPTTTPTSTSQQALLDALVAMKTKRVVLEPGAKGPDVGTVQKFLNVYNKTSTRVDNDFGPGMRKAIEEFQKKEKLTPDGGVGPTTLQAMISWLEKNT